MLWNRYHEKLLKKWSSTSKIYSAVHTNCANYYSTCNKRLGIPAILIGSLTASSIFSSEVNANIYWTYVNGGMALLVTALAGIQNFLGYSEKLTKHQTASFKYTKISMNIDTLLTFSRSERKEEPEVFLPAIKECMLEIRENCPEIISWVLEDYLEKQTNSILSDISSQANNKTYEQNQYNSEIPDIENQLPPINNTLAKKSSDIDIKSMDDDIIREHTPTNQILKKNLLSTIEKCTVSDDDEDCDSTRSMPCVFGVDQDKIKEKDQL